MYNQFYHPQLAPPRYLQNTENTDVLNSHIVVFGEGIISVPPEQANILLGVVTESTSLQKAQEENSERSTSTIEAITNLNVPKREIQTTDYRIEMMYDYVEGHQVFRGYKVTHLLRITLSMVDKVGLVVDTAIANGANIVQSIEFSLKDTSTRYLEALQKASKDGFTKAITIANSLHVTLDPNPINIVEVEMQYPIIPYQTIMLDAEATPIQPGTIKVKAKLKMTFTYGRSSF